MGHVGRFGEYGFGGLWWANWWVLLGIGLVAAVLLFIAWSLLTGRGRQDEHAGVDPEVYENMDGQIRSMLVQSGGALSQDRIGNNLGIPVADLARTLHAMEERGEVFRVWIPSEYTYGVQLAETRTRQFSRVTTEAGNGAATGAGP